MLAILGVDMAEIVDEKRTVACVGWSDSMSIGSRVVFFFT